MPSESRRSFVETLPTKSPTSIRPIAAAITPSAMYGPKRAKRDGGSSAPSRTAAIGSTRVARMAGRIAAISVTTMPTTSATTTVRVANTVPTCGRSMPNATKSAFSSFASPSPRKRPIDRRDHADHERLEHDRPVDLAARRSERAQRRELAHALGDRDAERVRDHEGADEERDEAEREQEVLEDRQEAVRVLRRLLRLLLARAHLRGRGQERLHLRDELRGRDVRLRRRCRSSRACPPCGRCAAPSGDRRSRASRRRAS